MFHLHESNVVKFRMTKTETEKDILALRYPIDVDVTDDIARKRSVFVVCFKR